MDQEEQQQPNEQTDNEHFLNKLQKFITKEIKNDPNMQMKYKHIKDHITFTLKNFEHSLDEIDKVKAELEEELKDGIYNKLRYLMPILNNVLAKLNGFERHMVNVQNTVKTVMLEVHQAHQFRELKFLKEHKEVREKYKDILLKYRKLRDKYEGIVKSSSGDFKEFEDSFETYAKRMEDKEEELNWRSYKLFLQHHFPKVRTRLSQDTVLNEQFKKKFYKKLEDMKQ